MFVCCSRDGNVTVLPASVVCVSIPSVLLSFVEYSFEIIVLELLLRSVVCGIK